MTNTVVNFDSDQTISNPLKSATGVNTLITTALASHGAFPFSNSTTYVTGNIVYYLGINYIAPTNIASGGGTPLANTTWRQIPTWGSYTTTATAAGTTTLDLYSSEIQRFSGTTTQTVVLPVVTTLPALGKPFYIINDSTGTVTVNSSGGNLVATITAGQRVLINCILLTGTTAASWVSASGYETATTIGALIAGSTAKTVLVDADKVPITDSAASDILKYVTWQNLKASISAYTTTATAAGTTTLTAASTMWQFFTGATTQTVVLPVTSTLYTGLVYEVVNNSSGLVTVQSSGANTILILAGGTSARFVCILTSGTTAASWQLLYDGVAVTSGKKLSATASLTLAGTDAKTLTVSNSLTLAGTDGKTLTVSNNLTLAGTDGTVMTFPSTTASVARIDAAQSFTGTQTFNNYLQLSESGGVLMDTTLSATGTFSIAVGEVGTLGETLAFGTLVYFKAADSRWWKCDSDAEATSGPVKLAMVCVAGIAGDGCQLMLVGKIRADSLFPTFTVGAPVHIGATAGEVVVAAPTSGFVRVVGYANTADEIHFDPSLEYYEKGTFSAGLTFGGGSTGLTFTSQVGQYLKRLKLVWFSIFLNLSNKGSSTGAARVTALPFTPSATHNVAVFVGFNSAITFADTFAGYIPGDTYIILNETTNAGVNTNILDTDFANNSQLMVSGNYTT